jgi:hypothetical protein
MLPGTLGLQAAHYMAYPRLKRRIRLFASKRTKQASPVRHVPLIVQR